MKARSFQISPPHQSTFSRTPHRSEAVRVRASAQSTTTLKTDKSEEVFAKAKEVLPGGVNSPVRAFKSVGGSPIVFDRVRGSRVFDVDGNEFIDYVGTWGPAIVGHANEEVNEALKAQIDKGTSFGAPCILEVNMIHPKSHLSVIWCRIP